MDENHEVAMGSAAEKRAALDRQTFEAFVAACKMVWDPKKLDLDYIRPPAIPRPIMMGFRF